MESTIQSFHSEFGYIAIAGQDDVLHALTLGHASERAAVAALRNTLRTDAPLGRWNPRLANRLCEFLAGQFDDFLDVEVDVGTITQFQRDVLDACRAIPPGETATYADLAAIAGSPRAARAVGNVMRQNRIPLIIPCHRVVGSGGALVGYSAGEGTPLKRQLLALEAGMSARTADLVPIAAIH